MFIILLPVGMNYRTERLPVVTFTLMGINTLVYLVSLIFFLATQGESDIWIFEHLWLIPSVSYPWTYLTSMFVHAGILHLLGNMMFLFLFGCCVEDMIGRLCSRLHRRHRVQRREPATDRRAGASACLAADGDGVSRRRRAPCQPTAGVKSTRAMAMPLSPPTA